MRTNLAIQLIRLISCNTKITDNSKIKSLKLFFSEEVHLKDLVEYYGFKLKLMKLFFQITIRILSSRKIQRIYRTIKKIFRITQRIFEKTFSEKIFNKIFRFSKIITRFYKQYFNRTTCRIY